MRGRLVPYVTTLFGVALPLGLLVKETGRALNIPAIDLAGWLLQLSPAFTYAGGAVYMVTSKHEAEEKRKARIKAAICPLQ